MKKRISAAVFVIACSFNSFAQGGSTNTVNPPFRQMAKDYFLCRCLYYGFESDSVFFKDNTMRVLKELLEVEISYEDRIKLDSFAKEVISKMTTSEYLDSRGTKPITWDCLDAYRGKDLENLIKSLKVLSKKTP